MSDNLLNVITIVNSEESAVTWPLILCCWCKEHLVVFVTDANGRTLPQLICGWL
jgi:hypothetical protein